MDTKNIAYDARIDGIPREHLAPVEKDAITDLKNTEDRYKTYHPYLKKAIEVVRRDPSCEKIEWADFSEEKNGMPVVCVQYETNVPTQFIDILNRHLSINEIEQRFQR